MGTIRFRLLKPRWITTVMGAGLMAAAEAAAPLEVASLPLDLSSLSLADLMNIEITSVSKRAEPLSQAAAAVYALTGDEIRRSGARSIAEALRLVPGLHVARIGDINTHVVSSRGFSDRLSDKLEVLVDGRSVYTPLFSGVFWDTLDVFMPDIERIEVIRGPGATLWGTNAINGVINIVTRKAADTQGGLLYAGVGTEERSSAGLRSGTAVGQVGAARVYAKHVERDSLKFPDGNDSFNVLRLDQAGFRADLIPAKAQTLTLSGDLYEGGREDLFQAPAKSGDVELSGGNVLSRWAWQQRGGSELSVQAYYDHSERLIPATVFKESRDIADVELQHRIPLSDSHSLVYGFNYRQSQDVTGKGPPFVFIFVPSSETLRYYGAFMQDQFALGKRLELTVGSKFEHNDYTGWEAQPNLRLGWQVAEGWFSWTAVSRAVRTPNRLDHDLATFTPAFRSGNPDQKTEKLVAYEAGLRFFGAENYSVDLAVFYNDYDDLRSSEAALPVPRFGNGIAGHSSGLELSLAWQASESLELRSSYSQLQLDFQRKPGSSDGSTATGYQSGSPEQQAGLRALWQPRPDVDVNGFLRYVGEVNQNAPDGPVPAYAELNLRLAWRPLPQLELALVGENLLHRQHGEFRTAIGSAYVEAERSGLLEMSWTWD
ncbi:MAG: TonB-dependent receptor [Pseudomonadota bacterium]